MKNDIFNKIRKSTLNEIMYRKKENTDKIKAYIYKLEDYRNSKVQGGGREELEILENMSFSKISNRFIGSEIFINGKNYIAISKIHMDYNQFENCIFKNLRFYKCTFYGSIFNKCYFENVVFESCTFIDGGQSITKKERYSSSSYFYNKCHMSNCSFINCNMEAMILETLLLISTEFKRCNLKGHIIDNSVISKISICDCDCKALVILNTSIRNLEFNDEVLTKLDKDTFFDKSPNRGIFEEDFEEDFNLYSNIASKFKENNLYNSYGLYYYLSKQMESKYLKGMERVKSNIYWIISGYGERPTYALRTSIIIIIIFALAYIFTGLKVDGVGILKYSSSIISNLTAIDIIKDFSRAFHFSVVTFTTVGYGNITPIDFSVILCSIEMFLGITMAGIWTATLAKKISR